MRTWDNRAMDDQIHRVERLGQVFTREDVVERMLGLRRNRGRVLEPSAGDGSFASRLPGCTAIEIDPSVAPAGALVMDFFDFPTDERFDTVIGNPPYVRYQDILPATRERLGGDLFDRRSNLYLFFIEKCVRHLDQGGELIFIVPRDFIKLTAARRLNDWLFTQGSITDFFETGDARVFGAYIPNCAVFRFEKGRMDRRMSDGRRFHCEHGQLMFLRGDYRVPLASLFDVRVGAVSGADDVFVHPQGNVEFVCSTTVDTGLTRRAWFDVRNDWLLQHKPRLLQRRVRAFGEHNWWQWGRLHHRSAAPRIYVNGKTRKARPFFLHECPDYDGSVLALFARDASCDLQAATALLNDAVDWHELGFVCDGRYLFSQRSLQNCLLPDAFAPLLPGKS
jgi:adenine-specific DNA-methyltransferase